MNPMSLFKWITIIENCVTATTLLGAIALVSLPESVVSKGGFSSPAIAAFVFLSIILSVLLGASSLIFLNKLRQRKIDGFATLEKWWRWSLIVNFVILLALCVTPQITSH